MKAGSVAALSVTATTTEGELHYQWYKSSSSRNVGGQAIVGATQSTYTPSEDAGTYYYYVTVWAVSGERSSTSVSSNAAMVTFTAAEPTPEPSEEPTPEPTPEPESTETPVEEPEEPAEDATPEPEEAPARRSGSTALVVAAVILLLGAAASVAVYVILRRRDNADEEDED